MARGLNEPPIPIRTLVPETFPALAELIERCLSLDPTKRPSSMAALEAETQPIITALGG